MKLKFCLLGENAFVDQDGKLSITQIFDIITTKKFPAVHPRMSIVSKWEFEEGEKKNKEYTQKLEIVNNATTDIIAKAESKIEVQPGKDDYLQFIVNVQGLRVDNDGEYTIKTSIGDQTENTIFKVKNI